MTDIAEIMDGLTQAGALRVGGNITKITETPGKTIVLTVEIHNWQCNRDALAKMDKDAGVTIIAKQLDAEQLANERASVGDGDPNQMDLADADSEEAAA